MIDPTIWANTPGLGRAPLVPAYQQPSGAATDPMADLARRLIPGGEGPTPASEMPIGAIVRDPATMTIDQMVDEARALEGPQRFAPNVGATLAAGGVPGLGLLGGWMGGRGIEQRQAQLDPAIEQRLGGILSTGQPTPRSMQPQEDRGVQITRRDAYDAGRRAAKGGQSEDQRDIERSSPTGSEIGAGGWAGRGGL